MACSEQHKLALFAVYIVSIVTALANPAHINYQEAYTMTQGANIVTLLLLSYCSRTWTDAMFAAVLGVAFTLRTTGSWSGGSRWDSLLVTIGMIIVLQHAFNQVVPTRVPHRILLYLAFSCVVLPVLAALPHLIRMPQVSRETLVQAAQFAEKAYGIPKDNSQLLGPLWKLYDSATDTMAGVTRVINQQGSVDLFVYFAGTNSTENWRTNANILGENVPTDWGCPVNKPMQTHKGFTKAFTAIAPKMLVAIESELSTLDANSRLVFCGHSLGGALATMAGLFATCKLPSLKKNIVVVTFGSPQVGDSNFVEGFNKNVETSVRVVNPMDPVPRLLNAQLVHVKGYYPVSPLSLDGTTKAHNLNTYIAAVNRSKVVSVVASFLPAIIMAGLIGLYIAWKMNRL